MTKGVNNATVPDGRIQTLLNGEKLRVGESLMSARADVRLFMQSDGNLVLYRTESEFGTILEVLWSTGTNGSGADVLLMQSNNNLVLYDTDVTPARAVWRSGTRGPRRCG
jgi:hypothetical protein